MAVSIYSVRFNQKDIRVNIVLLLLLLLVSSISVINSLISGLILSMIIIVGYGGLIIYQSFIEEYILELSYIWIIIFPVYSIIFGLLGERIRIRKKRIIELEKLNENLITKDLVTGFNNVREFYQELTEEMNKSKRHNIPLILCMVDITYFDELLAIYGKTNYNKIFENLSNVLNKSFRVEDKRYRISEKTFAFIMPHTTLDGAEVVKRRIKEELLNINLFEKGKGYSEFKIEVSIGIAEYNENIKSNMEFKKVAEKELEYDV
jgi:diguanylate cyclase (GGDEF)-like protein